MSKIVDHPSIREFDRRVGERFSRQAGNGGDDGMWQQSVESRLGDLSSRLEALRGDMNSDFRWTWAGIATMFVLLAGLAITGYLRLDDRLLSINNNITDLVISVAPKDGTSSP